MSQKSSTLKQKDFPLLVKIVNGGLAGIVGMSCVFPLDLVKTRLQHQQIGPNGEKMYKNMFDCFKKIYQAEGYFGMYRGSGVVILLVTPQRAIVLTANDYFRYLLASEDGKLSLTSQMLAGGLAGAVQIIVNSPMELLKIQLQIAGRIAPAAKLAGQTVEKISATSLTMQMLREKGISGLYRGLGVTALRDITFSIMYFPLFATWNDMGPRKSDGSGEAVFWCSFLSGLAAGCFSALLVTPFDVIKTRLQARKKADGENEYRGFIDCAVKTLKHEGAIAFMKGGLCRVVVIGPLFAIAQMVYYLGVGEAILGTKKGDA